MKTASARSPGSPARRGFTLIEMLAVIAILSVLMAFLLPAIMNTRRGPLILQVKTDITAIDGAIKSFKQDFGIEPPSSITLYEVAADWNGTSAVTLASRATISRLWPEFDYSIARDINDDGDQTDTFTLTGAECLVFFLGGVSNWTDTNANSTRDPGTDAWVPGGFSRNPANPFDHTGSNRLGPYIQFTSNRLIASSTNQYFFTYSDPVTGTAVAYLYISSNEGQGYNTADLGSSGMTDGYRNGATVTSPYWNPNGYQIISAGFDRKYGTGGPYVKDQKVYAMPVARDAERDNITNFSDGLLVP